MNSAQIKRILPLIIFAFSALSLFSACSTSVKNGWARAGGEKDYQRMGLSRTGIDIWEDGLRTDGGEGTFEWWYFDAKLGDGSTIVVVFYTKNMLDISTPMAPFVSVSMTDPDGKTTLNRYYYPEKNDYQFSKKRCDVRIGKNMVSGDLHQYSLHLDFDDILADINFQGTTPAWRPETGHSYFVDDSGETFFAWLPSIPQGTVNGTMSIGGKLLEIEGSAYHDHNWGNGSMVKQMHDWYWGRAEVGPYTVITAWITTTEEYGGKPGPVFFLSRDGKILAEDSKYVTCELKDIYVDQNTGKPVAKTIIYNYDDGTDHYRVTFYRERDIENVNFLDLATGLDYIVGKLVGFDGAYIRFSGRVTIDRLVANQVVDSAAEESAVWELMYFGHAPEKE